MSKDHFITIAGKANDEHLMWWCDCGAQGFDRAVLGYANVAEQADSHIRAIDWERTSK